MKMKKKQSPKGWWVGFAGPFATYEEALHYAKLAWRSDKPYLVNRHGEVKVRATEKRWAR